jgi:hypothetical protein
VRGWSGLRSTAVPPPYQPRDDCPNRLKALPCPLYGGPLPDLEWGPPGGSYRGAEELPIVPGPDVSTHKFGRCAECDALLMFDENDQPLRARR